MATIVLDQKNHILFFTLAKSKLWSVKKIDWGFWNLVGKHKKCGRQDANAIDLQTLNLHFDVLTAAARPFLAKHFLN